MSPGNKNILSAIITVLFILLYVYTGFSKLLQHEKFIETLRRVPGIKTIALPVSYFVPFLEMITAALLAFSARKIIGWYAAAALIAGFTIFVSAMLLSGSRLPCTCGGVIASMTWKQHLVFNVFFTALACFQLVREIKNKNKRSYA